MTTLRKNFNTRSAPMLYARDTRTGATIGLPGDRTPDIDWYNREAHGGHLSCLCCDASVHFNAGSEVKDGSRHTGQRAHFKSNPGEAHADACEFGRSSPQSPLPRDGFRLNFNTASASYFAQPERSIVPKGLEAVSMKSVQDLAAFMRRNDVEKMKRSFAVFREHESPWNRFILSDRVTSCRQNLIDTVEEMAAGTRKIQLCALELNIGRDMVKDAFRVHGKTLIKGETVKWKMDTDGIEHVILPRLSLDRRLGPDESLRGIFERLPVTVFAQGLATYSSSLRGKTRFHFFEMALVSRDQVLQTGLPQLAAENRAFHARPPSPLS